MNDLPHLLTNKQVVIFGGAGLSMGPPASLPGWLGLNDLLMEVLLEKIETEYRAETLIKSKFMSTFTEKRAANRFPPDYQAQIMEDQAGLDYFRSLSAVDSKVYSPIQYATALLAKQGCLRAVVTTNFDTMFEQAFLAVATPYQVLYDEEGYRSLAESLSAAEPDLIPIIKIHGTATEPASMVDTLKQRLKGRSQWLCNALRYYLEHYYFIYCGFSGADLDFDPTYLGIRAAAPMSPGFTFITRPPGGPRESIRKIMEAYGQKAESVSIDAPEFFATILKEMGIPKLLPVQNPVTETVRDRLVKWVNSIDPLKAVNMVNALVETLSIEAASRAFLDRIWNRRLAEDYPTASFPIFLRNLGRSYVFNFQDRYERAAAGDNYISTFVFPEDKKDEPTDPEQGDFERYAYELYNNFGKGAIHHRANNETPIGMALFSLMKCFEGKRSFFANFPDGFLNHAKDPGKLDQADIIYYYSFYCDLCADYRWFRPATELAITYAVDDHDWMREGFLRARFALNLALLAPEQNHARSKEECCKAFRLAYRLHDDRMQAEALLARGAVQRTAGAFRSSLVSLARAKSYFQKVYRLPQVIICDIELLRTIFVILSRSVEALVPRVLPLADQIREECEAFFQARRLNGFEPTFCYHWGWIIYYFKSGKGRAQALGYFTDAYNLAVACDQPMLAAIFKDAFERNGIWEIIKGRIKPPPAG
jgi:hypothetical protein